MGRNQETTKLIEPNPVSLVGRNSPYCCVKMFEAINPEFKKMINNKVESN